MSTELQGQVVLVTGCSTGIGRALARELKARGHRPFATARKLESLADLGAEGIDTLRLDVTDPASVRAAVDGLGIAYTIEALAEPFLRSGQLVRVLEDWSPSFEGLFLYYPGHRQVPAALRALIDMIRTARGSAPAKSSLQNPFTKD